MKLANMRMSLGLLACAALYALPLGCSALTEGAGVTDTDGDDDDDDDDATTSGSGTFTTTATSSDTTTGTTDNPSTTVDPTMTGDPTSMTDPPATESTTMTSETDGTTTDETETEGTTEDPTTGGQPQEGFSECTGQADGCLAGEACVGGFGFRVCAGQMCTNPGDCPLVPPGGNTTPECREVNPDSDGDECVIPCGGGGDMCPTGMLCIDQDFCVWEDEAVSCIDERRQTAPANGGFSTVGQGNDFDPATCAGFNNADRVVEYTAPAAGTYVFDTAGSAIDTALVLIDTDCNGAEIDCDNNLGNGNNSSRLQHTMAAGETVLVVVDGNPAGSAELNIRLQGFGDCFNNAPGVVCGGDELCIELVDGMVTTAAVCIDVAPECSNASDCTYGAPPGGSALVTCGDVGGNGTNECYLDCSGSAQCPDNMVCVTSNQSFCSWN